VHGALSESLLNFRLPATEGIAGWVVKNRKPALVRDVRRDDRFSSMIDEKFKFRTQSILAAPLIGNQKCYGVVEVLNQPGDEPFSLGDQSLLNLVCRAAGEALADMENLGQQES
jgi:GAF domain-containing protein